MRYSQVLSSIRGEGIQEFEQGLEAINEHIDIKNGVCRALVIKWLRDKKENKDFWSGRGTEFEPLLAAIKQLEDAIDLQQEYENALRDRSIPDAATMSEMQKSLLIYREEDVINSRTEGFVQLSPDNEPARIASQVLTASSRFFILSVKGSSGAHSIGIHRPYSIIGKSSDAYLFDPNIGEFRVNGEQNLADLLIALNTIVYAPSDVPPEKRIDLNQSYILWSYYGNPDWHW